MAATFDMAVALRTLKAAGLPCIGFDCPDLNTPATWVFHRQEDAIRPAKRKADPVGVLEGADRDRAVAIVQALLSPPEPSAQFWPSPLQTLADDVERIKRHVGLPDA